VVTHPLFFSQVAEKDAGALEIDCQRRVERELKGLILFLAHRIEASVELILLSNPR
jgi:hypothetical protein